MAAPAPLRSSGAVHAAIVGLSGPVLTPGEATLLQATRPVGVILFARNVIDPAQLRRLVDDVRTFGPTVFVDQEGGRVARLRPPHWPAWPAASEVADPEAAYIAGAGIGAACAALGIGAVCAPVLDRLHPDGHGVIGDRSYGSAGARVAAMGRAMADGLLAQHVLPIAKHAPGHGRAGADSHHALPVVRGDLTDDIAPFQALHDLPWMMTAHILYPDVDSEQPATLSAVVIERIIRGRIGFDGVLVTDDLEMGALTGSPGARATAALAAGCDVALHCSGVLADSQAVIAAAGPLAVAAARRVEAGWARAGVGVRADMQAGA